MKSFTPYQDRDAWYVIRGYVYQVHITISEWLELEPNVDLELECGEDIDRVQKGLANAEQDATRILEQIKHRRRAISLRSADVIQAIASFYNHTCANPKRKLRFRFLTTAGVGREQKSPIPGNEAAIHVWEKLRTGELIPEEQGVLANGIRSLLVEGTAGYPQFQQFLKASNDATFTEFLQDIQWSVNQPSLEELREQIQTALITSGRAPNEEAGQRIVERLFLHVFNVLCSKGRKVLTSAALERQLVLPSVDDSDKQVLSVVRGLLQIGLWKLEEIEGRVHQQGEWLTLLSEQFTSGISQPVWALHRERADIQGVPEPSEILVHRNPTLEKVREWMKAHVWTALYGDVQSGKTQLAIQLARDSRSRVVWIRLDGLEPEKESLRIDSSLAFATHELPSSTHEEWYGRMCCSLGKEALIVLDGLSVTAVDRALEERLVLLVESSQRCGVRLLSTCSRKLPMSLLQQLAGRVTERSVPSFDEQERIELFRLYGAPERMLRKKFLDLVGGITRNHPALLVSVVRYLKSLNWKLDDNAWDALLRSKYDKELKVETEQILKHTVSDQEARSLLYRLTVAMASFTEEDVVKVAAVKPEIRLPLERFHEVLDSWIRKDADGSYRVAPLLGNVGHENLAAGTIRKTHVYFAEKFFRTKPVTLLDAMSSIGHFHAAKEFSSAARILVLALNAFMKEERAGDDFGLSSVWVGVGFPDEIGLKTRLFIRGLQIVARHRLKKNYSELLKELDDLLDTARSSDALGVLGACVTVTIHLCSEQPTIAIRYAVRALRHSDVFEELVPRRHRSGLNPQLSSLLWACGGACHRPEDVEAWLAGIAELDGTQRMAFFKRDSISDTGCQTICDALWLRESDKPETERNWIRILELLTRIETLAKSWGADVLWAAAIRAQIVVQAEYLNQLDHAVEVAERALSESAGNRNVDFLLSECVGRQYRYARKWSEAIRWLNRALQEESGCFPFLRFRALLEASIACGKVDPKLAIKDTSRAVHLARKVKSLSELQLVVALGEKAIACWNVGDRKGAFDCWEEAATIMLDYQKREARWKELFGMLGHATGFFSALYSGIPPKPPSEYAVPEPGWFLRDRSQVGGLYDAKKDWFVAAHISMMAEGLGREEAASQWALRALDMGRKADEGDLSEGFGMYAISAAVAEDRFLDALEIAATAVTHLMAGGAKARRGPEAELTEREWTDREKRITSFAVVPAAFRLATIWLQNPTRCTNFVAAITARCRQIAESSHAPAVWITVAEALEEIFAEERDSELLLERSKSLVDMDEPARRILYFLGAMLHAGPSRAYALQLGIFPFLENTYKKYGFYRQNIAPFVPEFWSKSLDSEPYLYKQPTLLKSKLQGIEQADKTAKEKAILNELTWSLAIRPNSEMQEWLERTE